MSANKKFAEEKQQIMLLMVMLVTMVLLSLTSPFFMSWQNIKNILNQSTLNIIVGMGMCLVICTKGMDLSVGSTAAFSGAVMAMAMKSGVPVLPSVGLGLGAGFAIGFTNGFMVGKMKLNPFITTLASMSIFRAVTLIITKSIPIYGFSNEFLWLGSGEIGFVNTAVAITAAVAVAGYIILRHTKIGHYAESIGGNEYALSRNGVDTSKYKIIIYAISGFTAAIAGLIYTARLNSADPLAGYMLELDVIATVILGGTSINGGDGSISGTVLAGFFLAVLRNGLTINSIPSYYQQLVVGIVIIAAVITSEKSVKIFGMAGE